MPKPDKLQEVIDSLKLAEAKPHTLEECCSAVIAWVGSLDPAWEKRIQILREERGFSDKDIAGSLIAYPLDHSMHMEITTHPTLQAAGVGVHLGATFTCEMCGVEAHRKYAGQPALCSNRCANGFYARRHALAEERERKSQIPEGLQGAEHIIP